MRNNLVSRAVSKLCSEIKERKYQKIASKYNIRGYKRIYLIHIRKTGGTSLNNIFLSLSGEDPAWLYNRLAEDHDHRILSGDKIFVGWKRSHINRGNYFYAFSHQPLHHLNLPAYTFTVTCFRDPVKRVVSLYNMLMYYYTNDMYHPCMREEGKWLGKHFEDFLDRIPREHLCNQLYMFSSELVIQEALENIAKTSHFFFTEDFDSGVEELNRKTGLRLKPKHLRKAGYFEEIPQKSLNRLRAMLEDEYKLLECIR